MTGEEFFELYNKDTELRQYIVDQAKRHSRNKDLQEEFVQEAWLYISLARPDMVTDEYQNIAYNAIRNLYRAEKGEEATSFETYFMRQCT